MKMMQAKRSRVFEPHDTDRMQALRGIPLASFRARASAFAVDTVIVVLAAVAALTGYAVVKDPTLLHGRESVHIELFKSKWGLGLIVLYFGVLPRIWKGRTPGKRIFKLRVVSLSHERLTLWQCVERAFGYAFSSLEGGFGFIQFFLHPNRQTLHDRIAETIVVSERKGKRNRRAMQPSAPAGEPCSGGMSDPLKTINEERSAIND
jgi:uncharacterized RDD family membrane protein YckC